MSIQLTTNEMAFVHEFDSWDDLNDYILCADEYHEDQFDFGVICYDDATAFFEFKDTDVTLYDSTGKNVLSSTNEDLLVALKSLPQMDDSDDNILYAKLVDGESVRMNFDNWSDIGFMSGNISEVVILAPEERAVLGKRSTDILRLVNSYGDRLNPYLFGSPGADTDAVRKISTWEV